MSLTVTTKISLKPGVKLQFEKSQDAFVLLYPEGMVKLNDVASVILRACEDSPVWPELLADLEDLFDGDSIEGDVEAFLKQMKTNGWIDYHS